MYTAFLLHHSFLLLTVWNVGMIGRKDSTLEWKLTLGMKDEHDRIVEVAWHSKYNVKQSCCVRVSQFILDFHMRENLTFSVD